MDNASKSHALIVHTLTVIVAIIVTGNLYLSSAIAGELNGTEWKVTSGDTLYAIGRAVFPGDAPKQARLRQDVITLNPSVFAGGANNMKVGVVLKLPDYVVSKDIVSKSVVTEKAVEKDVVQESTSLKTSRPASTTTIGPISGKLVWGVKSGDTLFGICRSIYPNDARQQAQLGRDIKKLNPDVFANNASNMQDGIILKLPAYVKLQDIPSGNVETKTVKSTPVPASTQSGAMMTPEPAFVPPPEKLKPEMVEPEPQPVAPSRVAETSPKIQKTREKAVTAPSPAEGATVLSLGYSNGGERLVKVTNGTDIFAGTGFHFRLGYEQMFQQGSGYRASLGYQYYRLLSGNAVYQDTYLQIAYQYQVKPLIFGAGIVADAGAKLDSSGNTYKFDPAIGGNLYLEYAGGGWLDGWGIGITALNIKEKDTGTSFKANHGELYYRWKF